ncbi:MAG: 2-octaprenyl-6-methoxyphenyl hydroxylase [Pseudomonadales bacterium]|nr:2-octaprenyl-6-methoxyphenyl hydroxylase [Pseudomonadales bacterium]
MAEKTRYDVAIVGGGMAGASLALLLAHHLPALRILLLEQYPLQVNEDLPFGQPSFDDRTSALSLGTAGIFEQIGLWKTLNEFVVPIHQVHVSDRGHPAGTLLDAIDHQQDSLGFVIENRCLGYVLLKALSEEKAVTCMSPARVSSLAMKTGFVTLSVDGDGEACELEASLVVIADGAESALRHQLGIDVSNREYHQHALVANVSTEYFHQYMAFERFTDEGPLALLPMNDSEDLHRCALIWTNPVEQAEALMSLDDQAFLQKLQERFGQRLGRFLKVGKRSSYPLALVLALEQVRSNIVLLGNAAHSLHPVAGQSYNLAMRDAAVLVDTLMQGLQKGMSPGDLPLLQAYLERQQWDQHKTIGASHLLTQLFSTSSLPASFLRNIGLLGLDLLPGIKTVFARHAMGVAGQKRGKIL